jgi:hypothetical protein
MRKPTRLLAALTATGLTGATLVVLSAGAAAASDNRYSLFAQGDSQYYQVDGADIPVSRYNTAGSLTAEAQTDSTGTTTSFAGAPYYGKTAETAPGIINAVPNGFGYPHPLLPFAQMPGFVTATYPTTQKADDAQFYYKVHADAAEDGASASGSNGAPDGIPAPNQQQVATAAVKTLADGKTITTAYGSASGFIQGPLEVGNSVAKAAISDAGDKPKIESSVFGQFSIGGQAFGYNKNGFTYLGQSQDKKAALESANSALKAAGMELDVAPETTSTDPASGITTYTLGGLKVVSTFTTPNGQDTFGYILGRVQVASVNAPTNFRVASSVSKTAATLGGVAPAAHRTHLTTATPRSVAPADATFSAPATLVPRRRG